MKHFLAAAAAAAVAAAAAEAAAATTVAAAAAAAVRAKCLNHMFLCCLLLWCAGQAFESRFLAMFAPLACGSSV